MSPSYGEMSQGARANAAGQVYEKSLKPFFSGFGYTVMTYRQWQKAGSPSGKYALKDAPFRSIYDHDGKTEWLLINDERGTRVRVEVKTQNATGSVDEKIPYTYITAATCYEENDVILLLEGDGFKPGVRPWLRKVIDERWLLPPDSKKNIQLMNWSEFTRYFMAELS